MTVHTDHPFWDSVLHDSPAHFDQFAARLAGRADAGTPLVTLDLTKGVDYTAYTDAQNKTLQWRYCIDPPTDVHPKLTGTMSFDPQSVPHSSSDPAAGLRDYDDFSTYNQSTQGHLNSTACASSSATTRRRSDPVECVPAARRRSDDRAARALDGALRVRDRRVHSRRLRQG